MHPQVIRDKSGSCPICGMDLIKVNKSVADTNNEIKLSDQQIQLGNISFDTIHYSNIREDMSLPAILAIDQKRTNSISARISGRIQKLYYKNMGQYVSKNTPLYDIYSEELNNAKQEYIMALERQNNFKDATINFSQLVMNTKNKLHLWGMSESQIQRIASSKKYSNLTTFYSSVSGFITALNIEEGQYVTEGSPIINVAELSTLWAEAQVYATQLSSLSSDMSALITFNELPSYSVLGKIDFENPEVSVGSRINLIRVLIPNSNNRLKPGMQATVLIKAKSQIVLTLPSDAVLRDHNASSVWVKTNSGSFKNIMVTIGSESNGRIEIKDGLHEGDVVVITGAYLLNSEYIFKKGTNPMDGMKM